MRFVLMGAGGFAKELADMLELLGHEVVACFQESGSVPAKGHAVTRVPIVHDLDAVAFDRAALAVGRAEVRARFMRLIDDDSLWPVLVHPSASVSPYAEIGTGSVIMQNVVVSADARVGFGSLLNVGTYVAHDCTVGAHSHLAPSTTLGGGSVVGDRCELGLGTIVLPNVSIGAGCKTGAGTVVNSDLPSDCTAVGVPARVLGPRG